MADPSLKTPSLLPEGTVIMIAGVGIFSFFGNLLLLAGPLYMLQIYDRVLATRSIETLIGLTVITLFLLVIWGVLDFLRGRLLARLGTEFQQSIDRAIGVIPENQADRFQGASREKLIARAESIKRAIALPLGGALADVVWVPIFLVGLALFHPLLSCLAMLGLGGIVALHWLAQRLARSAAQEAQVHGWRASQVASQIDAAEEGSLRANHRRNLWRYWREIRQRAQLFQGRGADLRGLFETAQRTWKLSLQSAMLGLGAYLVLRAGLSPGAMVASTILLVRAIGPVDLIAAHWPTLREARINWRALKLKFEAHPSLPQAPALPGTGTRVVARSLRLSAFKDARPIDFELQAGEVLSVIGTAGSGKTALLRALYPPRSPAWGEGLAESHQYVAARPTFFAGSIAQNISGFRKEAKAAQMINAARDAGLSGPIEQLESGLFSEVGTAVETWPESLQYRLALAQAIYEAPAVLLLDDPFAAQPPECVQNISDLIEARSKAGQTTIFTARHPTALGVVQKLLWLEAGQSRGFGPRDSILARFLAPRPVQDKAAQLDLVS